MFYRITARSIVSHLLIGVASIVSVGTAEAQSTTTLTQVVNKATSTTLSATSSVNPSTFGQSVTLSTTLTAPLSSMATGTVQWFDGAIALGSPVPVTSGSSSLTIASLGGGSHTLTATYSGDSNFSAATSTPLTQVVQQAMPGTGGFAPVAVASSLNPSIYQNSVTFTATVPSGATGTIAFMDATTTLEAVMNFDGVV
jgi:Bacterial Ig-like domain (group 3)